MFGLFAGLVVAMNYALTRTKWGRSMTASAESRSRSSFRHQCRPHLHQRVVLCGMFAASGGVLAAARLASPSQQAGTGDVNLDAIGPP